METDINVSEMIEASWGALETSWRLLGPLGVLGASWSMLGSVLERPGEASGSVLGASWSVLGASWARLGAVLGPSWEPWGVLGASWARLEAVLRRLGGVLGRISLPLQLENDF